MEQSLRPDHQSTPSLERSSEIAELAVALALATAEIKAVPKSGYNNFDKYHYSTDSDIAGATRGAMAKHGLTLIPTDVSVEERAFNAAKGTSMTWTTVRRRYLLIHSSGQFMTIDGVGTATDRGDKGLYKAETGALKYVLKSLFNLACGDDPESASPEGRPGAPEPRRASGSQGKTQSSGSGNGSQSRAADPWKDAEPEKGIPKITAPARNGLVKMAQSQGVGNLDAALTRLFGCCVEDITQERSYKALHYLIKSGELSSRLKANAA